MTAPDPGLTDLIAAHQSGDRWTEFTYPPIFSDKPFVATSVTKMVKCSCGESMSADSFPAHVALVVEQHTNGRTAEANVRARARVKAANKRASIRITQIRKVEAARFEAEARAAKAEATIARVEKLQGDLFQQGGNLIAQWGAARLIRAALQEEFIRAAVEGE